MVNAHTALQTANGTVGRLQDQVSGLQSQGFRLLDEFDTIRGHARSTVSSAAGIAPSQSWLAGALSDIGNFVEGIGKGIGKSVWDLVSGKAIINFVEHPQLGDVRRAGQGRRGHRQPRRDGRSAVRRP